MKNYIGKVNFILLALILYACTTIPCIAVETKEKDEMKVVRVGYYEYENFQEYDKETGIYSGYGYEFLMALSQYTDWKLEFVPCTFNDALDMLGKGKIDLLNDVSKTDDRVDQYEFSSLNSGETVSYLVMKAGDTRVAYEDYEGIAGIKIGLSRQSIHSEQLLDTLKEQGVKPQVVWFDDHESVMAAADKGQVNHAIEQLRANNPRFEANLTDKYYSKINENHTVLTKKEQEYIKENPVVRVLYVPDWYPMSYQDDKGEFAGPIREIYDLLSKRTGLKFEFVPVDSHNDSNDIVKSYNCYVMADQPTDYSGASLYDVKLTPSFVSPSLVEISSHSLTLGDTIALVEGDYLSQVVNRVFGDKYKYVYLDTLQDCLSQVKNKTVDGTILISYEAEYYRQQREYSNLTYTIVNEGSYGLSVAISNKADPQLYSIIVKGLNSISKGETSNVFNQVHTRGWDHFSRI